QFAAHERVIVGPAAALASAYEYVLLRHQRQPRPRHPRELPTQAIHDFGGTGIALGQWLELYHHEAGVAAAAPAHEARHAFDRGILHQDFSEPVQLGPHGMKGCALVDTKETQ